MATEVAVWLIQGSREVTIPDDFGRSGRRASVEFYFHLSLKRNSDRYDWIAEDYCRMGMKAIMVKIAEIHNIPVEIIRKGVWEALSVVLVGTYEVEGFKPDILVDV